MYRNNSWDSIEFKCIFDILTRRTDDKYTSPVFCFLIYIRNPTYSLTIDILEVSKMKDNSCLSKIANIIDDISKSVINIHFIEFARKGIYSNSYITYCLAYLNICRHTKRIIKLKVSYSRERRLFWEFLKCNLFSIIYWHYAGDTNEIQCITNLTWEFTEGEFSSTIFRSLSNICDVSNWFTIEIVKISEVKECSSSCKIPDISNDIWKCCVNIGFIEFTMEWEYLDSRIGRWLLDFELSEHRKNG